jgi:sporulation protein YlmC with PRC-barrel domain
MSKPEKKAMTKDRLIGMQVIDSEGDIVGKVQDIAFIVGKVGMNLIVETKKGDNTEIPWEGIQAAGDFVILKPQGGPFPSPTSQPTGSPQAQPNQQQNCPICQGPLTYIPQYQRWYCYTDKKYV